MWSRRIMGAIFRDHKDAWIQQSWQQAMEIIILVATSPQFRLEDAIGAAALLFLGKLVQGVAGQVLDQVLQNPLRYIERRPDLRPPIVVPFLSMLVLFASIVLAARAPPLILAVEWESLAASAVVTLYCFKRTFDNGTTNLKGLVCIYNSRQDAEACYWIMWLCTCWRFRHVQRIAPIAILGRYINFKMIAEGWQPILTISRLPDVHPPQCDDPCAICLEEMMDDPKSLPCGDGHHFYGLCLARWKNQGKSSCPICHQDTVP